MVFKPLNLARQSFVKTFTHGYAQSLVAASQSSSASQNTSFHTLGNNVVNFFNKAGPSGQLQNAIQQHSATTPAGPGLPPKPSQSDSSGHDGGLAAYYAAWQHHRKSDEKELHQFQFAKRIGWKPPTTIPEQQSRTKEHGSQPESHKTSQEATAGPPQTPLAVESSTRVDSVDEASRESATTSHQQDNLERTPTDRNGTVDLKQGPEESSSPSREHSARSAAPDLFSTSPAPSTEATSVSEADVYNDNLTKLAERQQYAEIPAVFESMLLSGVKPNAPAYNALLLSAINLPRGRHQVASRVLDVYSDMLMRKVLPDTSTYAIVIELLAARSMDVLAMKRELFDRQTRYGGLEQQSGFLFRSDEMEYKILAEDDSLSLAIRLFDTAAAVSTKHVLPTETYRLLIAACAETGRIGDMVRIYADMESQVITPPTAIFAPMIQAFAATGDLRSSVDCYQEYKSLAMAHDEGKISIVRKDEEIYAAVVKAYMLCGQPSDGLKFLGKIEDMMEEDSGRILSIRDAVALQSLHPTWLEQAQHAEALKHALDKLSPDGQHMALSAICIDAANKNMSSIASEALQALRNVSSKANICEPVMALLAMHVRSGAMTATMKVWETFKFQEPSIACVEPTAMFATSLIGRGDAEQALGEARHVFARIREASERTSGYSENVDRIDEGIEAIGNHLFKTNAVPAPDACLQMVHLMVENGSVIPSIMERLLAGLGPEQAVSMPMADVLVLAQVQAGLLVNGSHFDVAHAARFVHLFGIITSSGTQIDSRMSKAFQDTLVKINRPDLLVRWQQSQMTPELSPLISHTSISPYYPGISESEDTHDPYANSTDFKGSSVIAEELEKSTGRHSIHLNEALGRFRNMRRAGRHPRYIIYAKLISAAAKEHQMKTAEDIVAMARQDIPLVPRHRIVRNGWVSILDAMVAACLTIGRRDLAAQHHQELANMGAAPTANTFGLYITTLKESTKTFDEATEAVKIFHQAKSSCVEPSSFLYNALIGKLGKARRIDDCLFYFAEMRKLGIRPTSVTYGTIVNALCRVSDDKFAEDLFDEMESMPNYKPRPAPYNSVMQYFLTTKRDRSKVLGYYNRMKANRITPTMHTYKLLIDTYATLEPLDLPAAEAIIDEIKSTGSTPEPVHYAALVHAKGCVLHDMEGARALFDRVIDEHLTSPTACLYQALFESYVANHEVAATEPLVEQMGKNGIPLTAYLANPLIHGWAAAKDIAKARSIFDVLGRENREPSTYEAMTRANLAVEDRGNAQKVVGEALRRGYPSAVANKICRLVDAGAEL